MKRGTLCWVDLEPSMRGEFGKTRPALIVSNSEQNLVLPSVVVVPLSSRTPEIWPLRLEIKISGEKTSYAVIPGMRQISKTRIQQLIGEVTPATLDRIAEALLLYLG